MKKTITSSSGITYQWENISLDEASDLIKKHNGEKMSQYIVFDCEGSAVLNPYLLNDNRVVNIRPRGAGIFSSLKGYMTTVVDTFNTKKYIPMEFPIQKIEYLPGGNKIFCFQISNVEGEIIKNIYPTLEREHYPYSSHEYEIYRTNHSEIVEYRKIHKTYTLYQNEVDYQKVNAKRKIIYEVRKNAKRELKIELGYININMCGRNPYAKDFLNHIDDLIAKLPELLHYTSEVEKIFTRERNSLPLIDRMLYRHLITDEFADRLFLPLLAYIGQIHIKENDSKWIMHYDTFFDSWTPDIEGRDGPIRIYDQLLRILDSTNSNWYPLMTVLNK